MEIKYWAGTDVGRKRSDNEDNFLIDKRLRLFVVADGMGGHASGEIASAMAVHGIREVLDLERDILDVYDDDDPKSHVEVCTLLEYAVHYTCAQIFHKARREPEKRGMGTTLIVLLIIGARGFIAYVGDSRIYLLRGDVVYQLTEDHSLRNELIRMGKITADEFETSPYANLKNAMTRAVGVYESVEVDTLDFDIIPGDAFLLCSDGLYEYLSDEDISNAIALPQIREIPGMLIDAANSRGGKDNITAVVVQIAGGEDDQDRAAELNFTLDTLKNVPLFRELSYQQLVRVMNLSRQSALEPGQVLCREGEPGHELMVVLRGRLELTRNGVNVAELGPGAHLGEMSLIDAGLRSVTATATEPGKVLAISRDDFYEVLRREPALAVKLLWSFVRVLADRLRTTTADLAVARTSPVLPDLTELAEEASRATMQLPIIEPDESEYDDDLEHRPTMISGMLGVQPAAASEERRATIVSTTTQAPKSAADRAGTGPAPGPERTTTARPPIGARPRESSPPHASDAGVMSSRPRPASRPANGPANTGDTLVPPSAPRPRPASGPANIGDTLVPPSKPPRPASGPVNTGDTLVPPSKPRPRPTTAPAPMPGTPQARPPQVTMPIEGSWSPSPKPTRNSPAVVPLPQAPTAPLEAPHLIPRAESDAPKRRGGRRSPSPQVPGTPFTPTRRDASSGEGLAKTAASPAAPLAPPIVSPPARRDDTMIAPAPLPPTVPKAPDSDAPRTAAPRQPIATRQRDAEPNPDVTADSDTRRTQTGFPALPLVPPPPPMGGPKPDEPHGVDDPPGEPDA